MNNVKRDAEQLSAQHKYQKKKHWKHLTNPYRTSVRGGEGGRRHRKTEKIHSTPKKNNRNESRATADTKQLRNTDSKRIPNPHSHYHLPRASRAERTAARSMMSLVWGSSTDWGWGRRAGSGATAKDMRRGHYSPPSWGLAAASRAEGMEELDGDWGVGHWRGEEWKGIGRREWWDGCGQREALSVGRVSYRYTEEEKNTKEKMKRGIRRRELSGGW